MKNYHILQESQIRKEHSYDFTEISPFDVGIPLLDCSDETITEIYYYRWHSFCSHIKETPLGYIFTEFTPSVPWEGIYGSIVCPAGHHMYEARWMYDRKYLEDYARFWFKEGADPMLYSTWLADAVYAICMVTGDFSLAESLYEKLKENYANWEKQNRMRGFHHLLYQIDDLDGMEYSASGNGCRPTINSYQYGDAIALSKIAARLGKEEEEAFYLQEAEKQKQKMDESLWDGDASFYKNRKNGYYLCDVRELIGYIPWYFHMPDADKSDAWKYLNDENYFYAPFGPTTCEQNHPEFMKPYPHMCLWNGPSWPFATTQTLVALANFLNDQMQDVMRKGDYYNWVKLYANSHYLTKENGERIPWIDENLDPFTGEWLARKIMLEGDYDELNRKRGIHYNHSGFCDLIISGLAGIRPGEDNHIKINPLFEEADMDYFCMDGVRYHEHVLTVLWDKTGERYHLGAGMRIYVDGALAVERLDLGKIMI